MNNKNCRIMIIDDTPANLDVLSTILEFEGYQVIQFPRGSLAIAPARSNPPDLILLDIMMPEMDGYEVCSLLKMDPVSRDIPIIFLSALTETEEKVRAFHSGAVDYITKPFQAEEVLARVNTHLTMNRMRKELLNYSRELERRVDEKVHELYDSQMATLQAISSLAEFRDEDTGLHIERTRLYCKLLAVEMQHDDYGDAEFGPNQIDEAFIRDIYYAAPLHDIGKIGIPDNILLKPGRLSTQEFDVIKRHVPIGVTTLRTVYERYPKNSFINLGIRLTASHHERWDGSGYPSGLEGTNIPLAGRIMALADVYDALRSKRPYKEPMPHEEAMDHILQASGSHFDPDIVRCFKKIETDFEELSHDLMDE